ncbi:uncharacterized protein [Leptinotarsa decemlineata]|uniref:uncharacterized protein n=1 Tax=Leptinotarsa decemlineata TaxID=7539 RepID=UPI003D305395
MILLIENLASFDRSMMTSFGMQKTQQHHNRAWKFAILGSIAVSISAVSIILMDLINFPPRWSSISKIKSNITYCVPVITSNFLVLQLSAMILIIKERFRWINLEAENLRNKWNVNIRKFYSSFSELEDNWHFIYFKNRIVDKMEHLRRKYTFLQTQVQELDSTFSLRILAIVSLIFFAILAIILFFVIELPKAYYRKKTLLFTVKAIEILISNLLQLLTLCICSTMLYKEAENTLLIFQRFEMVSMLDIDDLIEYFSNQMLLTNVEISPFDMFTLDISLIFSVLRGISSYLIVCIQFYFY